jgi:hypothetical protein
MKTETNKKANKKFDLKKVEIAKLKNIHLINGENTPADDPIDTNQRNGGSTANCR